jgi:hypothetical protein
VCGQQIDIPTEDYQCGLANVDRQVPAHNVQIVNSLTSAPLANASANHAGFLFVRSFRTKINGFLARD